MDYENSCSRVVLNDMFCECVGVVGLGSLVTGVFCDDVSMRILGGVFLVPSVVKYSARVGKHIFDKYFGRVGV